MTPANILIHRTYQIREFLAGLIFCIKKTTGNAGGSKKL